MEEERRSGITIKGLLIRLILIIIFIFLLIWLFPMPDLKPLNNQIFSDNLDRMKEVAKTYYTTERLPKDINSYKKMTLEEMIDNHYILPLMDSNGKYCSAKNSYVQITKLENEYVIKVYLSCTDKKDYIIEHFGCYDICSNECKMLETTSTTTHGNKKITTKKSTVLRTTTSKGSLYEYQFAKNTCTENFDKYVCPAGYSLVGSNCIKNGTVTSVVAANEKTEKVSSTDTKDATAIKNTVTSLVGSIKKTMVTTLAATKINTYDTKGAIAVKKTTISSYVQIQNYSVITADQIATSYKWTYDYTLVDISGNLGYENANEKLVKVDYWTENECDTCFTKVTKYKYYHYVKTYDYTYSCDAYSGYSLYNGKYCRKATNITTSCPSGYTDTGSNCKKTEVISYNCNRYGSDYVLDSNAKTCTKTTTSYSCPAGTTPSADGTKCTKTDISYTCPAGTSATADQTKCLKSDTTTSYSCPTGYALVGNKCVATITTDKKTYSCDRGVLSGTTCIITDSTSDVKKAEATYKTSCTTNYKWSTSTSVAGWEYTGNKRLVK